MTVKSIGKRQDYKDADCQQLPIMTQTTSKLDKFPELATDHSVVCQQETFLSNEKTMHLCETLADMQALLKKYHSGHLKSLTWYSVPTSVCEALLKDNNTATSSNAPELSAMHFIVTTSKKRLGEKEGLEENRIQYLDSTNPYSPFYHPTTGIR